MLKEKVKKELRDLVDVDEAIMELQWITRQAGYCKGQLEDIMIKGTTRALYDRKHDEEGLSIDGFFKQYIQGHLRGLRDALKKHDNVLNKAIKKHLKNEDAKKKAAELLREGQNE